jgi:hypothetical protein
MIVPKLPSFDGFKEGVFNLKRFAFAMLGLGVLAMTADAGPFRRKTAVVSGVAPVAPVVAKPNASTTNAQGAALLIVQTGRFRHNGHPFGLFEGIGMASTQQGAIQNCCFWGKRNAIDIGTAQMSNGMWVAVVRYR